MPKTWICKNKKCRAVMYEPSYKCEFCGSQIKGPIEEEEADRIREEEFEMSKRPRRKGKYDFF